MTRRSDTRDLGPELCELFGIDPADVTRIEITVDPHEAWVTVHHANITAETADGLMATVSRHFRRPIPE